MMVDSHQRIAPMSPGQSVSLKLLRADVQGIRDEARGGGGGDGTAVIVSLS